MKTVNEKTLSQIVHELLHPDGCWHEWTWHQDEIFNRWKRCKHCKLKVSSESINYESTNPDYENDLNAAWQCVEYIKNQQGSMRKTFTRLLRQHVLSVHGRKTGELIMLDNIIFWLNARAICLAFVDAMKGE